MPVPEPEVDDSWLDDTASETESAESQSTISDRELSLPKQSSRSPKGKAKPTKGKEGSRQNSSQFSRPKLLKQSIFEVC